MSNVISYEDAASRLASQAGAVGHLAQDSGAFAAVVAAFEARDPDAFRWVLERVEMLPYCELICEWVRVKLGVLRCIELCGVPREKEFSFPNFRSSRGLLCNSRQMNRFCGESSTQWLAAMARIIGLPLPNSSSTSSAI